MCSEFLVLKKKKKARYHYSCSEQGQEVDMFYAVPSFNCADPHGENSNCRKHLQKSY